MQTLPNDVRKGMPVYDRSHQHIGTVDDFKFSENEDDPDVTPATAGNLPHKRESILTSLAEAFAGDELPEGLQERLLREGYVRLDADGLLAADRYVLPEQIAFTQGDELVLNVDKKALIKEP